MNGPAQPPARPLDIVDTSSGAGAMASEWRNWPVVLTAAMGMSLATIAVYSTGLFFAPLEREFGWSRAEVSFGMTIYSIVAVPLGPFMGALVDRLGARRVAIPGVVIFGLMFAALSFAGPSIWSWWALWIGIALASLSISPILWIAAVSSHFEKSRGLAIALTMCGTAISSFFTPLVARWLIDIVGWRQAYSYIGLGWAALALMLVLPFFIDARGRHVVARTGRVLVGEGAALVGLTFRQAVGDRAFQKLALASLLVSLSIVGTTIHLMPILTIIGLSREAAAGVLSSLGIASAVGKLATGWLFDRMDARPVAAVCLALPALPLLLLKLTPDGDVMLAGAAVALLGFAAGAELSATACLTTRYVGPRAFAQNYAIISSIMALSAGVGPLIAGIIYDMTGGYSLLLLGGMPAALLAGLCIATMGASPDWSRPKVHAD